jgi:hypothetical protein
VVVVVRAVLAVTLAWMAQLDELVMEEQVWLHQLQELLLLEPVAVVAVVHLVLEVLAVLVVAGQVLDLGLEVLLTLHPELQIQVVVVGVLVFKIMLQVEAVAQELLF